jgi:hypothetical protein
MRFPQIHDDRMMDGDLRLHSAAPHKKLHKKQLALKERHLAIEKNVFDGMEICATAL